MNPKCPRPPQPANIHCRPFLFNPTAGPASGLWPQGSGAASSAPAPTPAPAQTCIQATIFADCFPGCSGVISDASPGPVCDWTFIEPFGNLGGQFTFTPGVMSMDTVGSGDFPIAAKPLSAPLASVFGLSGQFSFTEYPTPPNGTTTYEFLLNNSGITETLVVALFGDGTLVVQAGDPAAAPTYTGTWTSSGGSHVVFFTVDALGVPRIFLDGVELPLTFAGASATSSASYPDNSISYGGGAGVAQAASSPIQNLFVSGGVLAADTEFCCA